MGLKPILRNTTSFSALTLLVGSFDPQKTVPEMTYNVFSGTLNPTHFTSLLTIEFILKMIVRSPVEMKGYCHESIKEDIKHAFSLTLHD